MDPVTIVLLLVLAGGVSAFVAMRGAMSENGPGMFRSTSRASVLVGGLLVLAALVAAAVLVLGR